MLEKWIETKLQKGDGRAAKFGRLIVEEFGDEPFPSVATPVAPEARVLLQRELVRAQESTGAPGFAISEYKARPLTPELVDRTWQTIWKVWGENINHTFQVPSCDRTSEGLVGLREKGRAVLLVPDELYTKEGLILLGRMFPTMQSWSVMEGTTVTNDHDKGGSIDIEMDIDAPNRNTNEMQAMDTLKREGRRGQRLTTFIVGSQFSKLSSGRYLEESFTWSRVPGSRDGIHVLNAGFSSDGSLYVDWSLGSQNRYPLLGFRSEGVKESLVF